MPSQISQIREPHSFNEKYLPLSIWNKTSNSPLGWAITPASRIGYVVLFTTLKAEFGDRAEKTEILQLRFYINFSAIELSTRVLRFLRIRLGRGDRWLHDSSSYFASPATNKSQMIQTALSIVVRQSTYWSGGSLDGHPS